MDIIGARRFLTDICNPDLVFHSRESVWHFWNWQRLAGKIQGVWKGWMQNTLCCDLKFGSSFWNTLYYRQGLTIFVFPTRQRGEKGGKGVVHPRNYPSVSSLKASLCLPWSSCPRVPGCELAYERGPFPIAGPAQCCLACSSSPW